MLEFNFYPFPELATERLCLRQILASDLEDFYALRENDAVRRYIQRPPQTIEQVQEILQKTLSSHANNESISWAICFPDQPKLIGVMGFWRSTREHHYAEIGYSLLPEFWGKGIASEAMLPILKYGFEQMRLHRVEADVDPANAASVRLLEKFGFVREAHFKENYFYDGRFFDSFIFSLLRTSWSPTR